MRFRGRQASRRLRQGSEHRQLVTSSFRSRLRSRHDHRSLRKAGRRKGHAGAAARSGAWRSHARDRRRAARGDPRRARRSGSRRRPTWTAATSCPTRSSSASSRRRSPSRGTPTASLLDGVVRTVPQAEGLAAVLQELGRKVDAVLVLRHRRRRDRAAPELRARSARSARRRTRGASRARTCDKCGGTLVRRKDDEPEAIRNRLARVRAADGAGARVVPRATALAVAVDRCGRIGAGRDGAARSARWRARDDARGR